MDYVYKEATRAVHNTPTRNPYDLLQRIGAVVRISNEYEPCGLKGYSTIIHRQMFAVINGHLDEHERMIVAGHEAAHLILHKADILLSPAKALRDFNLFNDSGRLEYQANRFLADFLVPDSEVLSILVSEADFFETAREVGLPPPLLAFKLHSMMRRGFDVHSPLDLQSGFLGAGGTVAST